MLESALKRPSGEASVSAEAVSGLGWMVVCRFLLLFTYLASSVLLVRMLSATAYGAFSVFRASHEAFAPIIALGLNTAALRFLPELIEKGKRSEARIFAIQVAFVQLVVVGCLGVGLLAGLPVEPAVAAAFASLLVVLQLKRFFFEALTGLFAVRAVVLFSALQGMLWLPLAFLLLSRSATLLSACWSLLLASAVVMVGSGAWLGRELKREGTGGDLAPIPWSRLLHFSLPLAASRLIVLLMAHYTEVFFLAYYFGMAVAGAYELGYSLASYALRLFPDAIYGVMMAVFAQSYARDRRSLPAIMRWVYKMFMIFLLPISAAGLVWGGELFTLLYGENLLQARMVVRVCSVTHLLGFFSMPLAMALVTKEKNAQMLPFNIGEAVVNIFLDFLLIPTYGIVGAVLAVPLTFAVTLPVRIWVLKKLVGGIYFPLRDAGRLFCVAFGLAFLLRGAIPVDHLLALSLSVLLYGFCYIVFVRILHLLSDRDVAPFLAGGNPFVKRVVGMLHTPMG